MPSTPYILENGITEWYQNGELHRLDGPAIEYANGHKEWFIDGNQYLCPLDFCKAAKIEGNHRTLFLLKFSFSIANNIVCS